MEKRATDPLQILILVLLTLNLALTGSLWISKTKPSNGLGDPEISLPSFADSTELSRIAEEIRSRYNNNDIEGLYDLLDPIAHTQLTINEFKKQHGEVSDLFGNVDSAAYSHFEKTKDNGRNTYVLHYLVRFSNGTFDNGTLKISAIARDDKFNLLGFNFFGETKTTRQ